ncbi:flagellar assembly factor FliW [Alteribacillus persepolensis]|uniref:Flagellar assembly factor FliW n=1 Tax=Alteribacillus persepolensis TaxID=568899 RepID=A0A1G8AFF9_9BACI|nr:flagellar assembly protein FliW [Alteribacillus persepolensis]SDH19631.1 flagellar assembly factor FliW [Alteribacillus persepolensis]
MKLRTKHLGEVEVEESAIYTFEQGLPAFEEETSFVLLPFSSDDTFWMLQSMRTPKLALVIADPFVFFPDYRVELTDVVIEQLAIEKEEDVAIFSVLTLQEPFTNTTANLQAPIVLNAAEKKGKQMVGTDTAFKTKHPLFPRDQKQAATEAKGGSSC